MTPSSAKRTINPPDAGGFAMRACRRPACRLRFPAPAGVSDVACPRCGGPTGVDAPSPAFAESASPAPPGRAVDALLDNVRSVFNVGAAFRTADGAGLGHLYLGGFTATPDHPRLAKTALGAEEAVPWSHHPDGRDVVAAARAAGAHVVALEGHSAAQPLFTWMPPDDSHRILLVVGNENAGVDPAILAASDTHLALPMVGRKRSLNVAVAFGIGAYWLRFAGVRAAA